MPNILGDKWFTDKWEKINESIWTRLFIIVSIIQTILVIVLESRVFIRNHSIRGKVEVFKGKPGFELCDVRYSSDRMMRIEQENVVFIIFQVYQLWFCFNVVFGQNTIQLIAVTIMNSICAGYSIIQILEVKVWYADFNKSCSNTLRGESKFIIFDLPLVISSILFAIIMGFIAYKLYKRFGWIIYRKIGGSIEIQAIYRRQLILVNLLKIDLFFLLLFSIESWILFTVEGQANKLDHLYYVPKVVYYFHKVMAFVIIILEVIAYRSIKREDKNGMMIFIFSWIAVILDLILLLLFSIRTTNERWYFLISIIIVSVIASIITLIYSVLVTKDFGKGLKEILTQFEMRPKSSVNNKRFTLD